MTLHWTEKRAASANVAHALQQGGWQLLGYHADQSDSQSNYYHPASWMDGIATHPEYPGVIVGFDVSAKSAETRSGTDQIHTDYVRTDDCPTCNGSGHDLNAPATTYRISDAQGWHVESKPAPCPPCHGRGYLVARVDTVLFTWPTFHGTPRGKAWHVEYMGQIIASGTGFQRAASHRDGPAAAQAIAADITGIARRCVGQSATASADAVAASDNAPAPTTASRNGLTITCTYTVKNGSVWTWPAIAPRIARDRYEIIKQQFGIRSSRVRHALYITQQIDAAAILALVEPELAPADAPNAAPTLACATCGDTGVRATTAPAHTLFVSGNTRVVSTTMPCPDCTDDATAEPAALPEPDPTPVPADTPQEPAAPAPLPETPSAPPALTFTVDAATFKTIFDACAASSMCERGHVRGYVHAGRLWATSGTWTGPNGAGAWASEIVPRVEWIGDVTIPERYGGSFQPGTVANAGRLGAVVITAQTATFRPEPIAPPAPIVPPTLAPGQRWTLDRAFQSFDDDSGEAFHALDLARPLVGRPIDASTCVVAGATVTGDHCTCKKPRGVLTCRHVLAVRLLRHYRDDAPTAHAAPIT